MIEVLKSIIRNIFLVLCVWMWLAGVAAVPAGSGIGAITGIMWWGYYTLTEKLRPLKVVGLIMALALALPLGFPFHCLSVFICFKSIKKIIVLLVNMAGGTHVNFSANIYFNVVILLISLAVGILGITLIGIKLNEFVEDSTDLDLEPDEPAVFCVGICQVGGAISGGLISLVLGRIPFVSSGDVGNLWLGKSGIVAVSACLGTWAGTLVGSFLGAIIFTFSILRETIEEISNAEWPKLGKASYLFSRLNANALTKNALSFATASGTATLIFSVIWWVFKEVVGAIIEWVVQGGLNKVFPWFK